MIRFFLFFALTFTAGSIFASGKISIQNNLHDGGQTYGHIIGLSVYEKITKGIAVNSWFGYGDTPFASNEDTKWITAKGQIDFYLKNLTLSPGIQYRETIDQSASDTIPYFKIEYTLWR